MAQKRQSLSLQQIVDLYESESVQHDPQEKQSILLLIFTHTEIKSSLKNQALILKRIFTHQHLARLIDYLKEQNEADAQQLKKVKFDPSGENIPLCLKLPFMAMEILCCQCQIINQLLFTGSPENPEPLLPKLLQFLDHSQHYHLACYFSKVMSAITKRVSSSTHKYNPIFCKWVFGEDESEDSLKSSCLFKSIRHLYSLSSLDYICKWLLVSGKQTEAVEVDGKLTQKTFVNFRRSIKLKFLLELLRIVNKNLLQQDIISNISTLFEQMLSHSEKAKKIPGLSLKSLGPSSNAPKVTLYDLAAEQQIVSAICQVPDEGCLTGAKLSLIKVLLQRYVLELQSLRRNKGEDEESPRRLLELINADNLLYLFEWMVEHLKICLQMTSKDIASQNSTHIEEQTIEKSRILISSGQKLIVLQLCELIRMIHSLESCRVQLTEYYNEHSSTLVSVVTRLMTLDNNLIHLETSKIVLAMIRPQKGRDESIPFDFARKLLLHAIIQLIEQPNIKPHILDWADILLSLETEHIFQDYEEEFEWEHIREVVEEAKQLHVGEFRMVQANIDCFYSEEKAKIKYAHFLTNYKAVIHYEQKKDNRQVSEKTIVKAENVKPAEETEDGESSEFSMFFLSNPNDNYLKYDLDELLSQI